MYEILTQITSLFFHISVFPVCNGYGSINGEGFPDAKYNTAFEPIKDENGVPVQIAHRVVFGEKEFESENSRKCLYWEDDLEQWRLGQCIAIGKNVLYLIKEHWSSSVL